MRTLLIVLCLMTAGFVTMAQSEGGYSIKGDKGRSVDTDWMDKFYVGGGIGSLSWNSYGSSIGVSALAGYRWTEKINTGLGYDYYYEASNSSDVNLHTHALNVFTQYLIHDPVFLMAQYQLWNYRFIQGDQTIVKGVGNAVMLGGGYSQRISNRSTINAFVLYDVLYEKDVTPYGPVHYGINFTVGF
ncbi:MAG: hypothetical protein OCD76_14405 [Reichenbachiella sp.]